jgi:hypothetical protein
VTAARSARLVIWVLALVGIGVRSAPAQTEPAFFLHGLRSSGSDWAATASRLQDQLAITEQHPDLPWQQTFEDQARSLSRSSSMAGVNSLIAIGHSNGGLVARELSRLQRVDGIATIGTPHRGAPILPHFGQWLTFQAATPSLLNEVLGAFSTYSDWSWTFAYVQGALSWISDFSIWSVVYLGTSFGIGEALPVTGEMLPASGYLSDLNSAGNLQREAATVPARVGVVSVAHNFFWAGPARAILPGHADEIATALYSTAFGLISWSGYIAAVSDPTDMVAFRQSTSLMGLGGFLLSIDPTYCALVSGSFSGECIANDGVVPVTSQEYPGAPNIYIGLDNDGPAHSQEKEWGESVLYDALTWYLHVPLHGAQPPPPNPAPPPPTPPPGPDPGTTDPQPSGGDGNHDVPPAGSDPGLLSSGEYLNAGGRLDSGDGRFHFIYQDDGNLVLYDEGWSPIWASHTEGSAPGSVVMQYDGNFVMYDAYGVPVWASDRSFNHPGAYLIVQSDGNVVIYDVDGTPLWATDTWR